MKMSFFMHIKKTKKRQHTINRSLTKRYGFTSELLEFEKLATILKLMSSNICLKKKRENYAFVNYQNKILNSRFFLKFILLE